MPPALAIAAELARCGHTVALAGHGPRAADALSEGAELLPLEALSDHDLTRASSRLRQLRDLKRMGTDAALAREVGAIIDERRPDAVVVDCMMLSALRAALASAAPTAALFHSFGAFMANAAKAPLKQVSALLGVPTVRLWEAARARILPTDRELDPAGDGRSPVAFDWVGTTEAGAPPAARVAGDPPLVLASLSSAWAAGQADLYRRIVAALAGQPARLIVTTGGAELEGGLDPAPGVEILGRAPHGELLPRVDLVIGHGGHSTTMKALAHGVPLLILPVNPMSDQPLIGRTIEARGLGRTLPRTASAERIRQTALGILADGAIRAAAARTGERLRGQRGAARAVELLEARCGLSA